MAKLATKDTDGKQGMTVYDQWGLVAIDSVGAFGQYVLAANNAQLITKDAKGIHYNMASTSVINTFQYVQDWICKDNSMYKNSDLEAKRNLFINGNALFYSFCLGDIKIFNNMKDDFGVVPFPKGNNQSDYVGNIDWNRSVLAVPVNIEGQDLDDVGYLLDSLARHSENEQTVYLNELKNRYTRDTESKGMIDIIDKTARLEITQLIGSTANPELFNATYKIQWDVLGDSSKSPAEYIAQYKTVGKTAVADYMKQLN